MYYYRNRMYSADLGRFISKDPKGYVDGMNLYAYVMNNPLKYSDPMGTVAQGNNQITEIEHLNSQDYSVYHGAILTTPSNPLNINILDQINNTLNINKSFEDSISYPFWSFFKDTTYVVNSNLEIISDENVKISARIITSRIGHIQNGVDLFAAETPYTKGEEIAGMIGGTLVGSTLAFTGAVVGTVDSPGIGTIVFSTSFGLAGQKVGSETFKQGYNYMLKGFEIKINNYFNDEDKN